MATPAISTITSHSASNVALPDSNDITEKDFSVAIAEIVSKIISSPEFNQLWTTYYRSQTNPAIKLADEFNTHAKDLFLQPHLAVFARELLHLERRASQGYLNFNQSDDYKLKSLEETLLRIVPAEKFSRKRNLSESENKIIDVIERETGQKPFRPIRSSWNLFTGMWKHIWDEIKTHPILSSLFTAMSVGAWRFMKAKMGSTATVYIDPILSKVVGDIDPLNPGDTVFDPSAPTIAKTFGCHNDVKNLTGSDAAANFVRDYMPFLSPEHCGKIKTLASGTQDALQTTYNFMVERLAAVTGDRVEEVGKILPKAHCVEAFNKAAHNVAEVVYLFDSWENVVVHSIILVTSAAIAYKAASLSNTEAKENFDKICDFFNRTAKKNYLSWGLGVAGAYAGYKYGQGINPGIIWASLAGAGSGQISHKIINTLKRKNHAENILSSTQTEINTLDDLLKHSTISIGPQSEVTQNNFFDRRKKIGLIFAVASGAVVMLVGADAHGALDTISNPALRETLIGASQVTGYTVGGGTVIGTYLAVNVPQDAALHVIFGVVGGAIGLTFGGGVRTTGWISEKTGLTRGLKWVADRSGLTKTFNTIKSDAKLTQATIQKILFGNDYIPPPP